MEHNLLQQYKFDFSKWCHTVVSDMTACAVNVAMEFLEDSIQVDCEMHQLNTCLKYGLGLYENTSTKFAKDGNGNFLLDDTGNRYKITTFTTPGGEFIDDNRIITSLRSISNYFFTAQRKKRLKQRQENFNCKHCFKMWLHPTV